MLRGFLEKSPTTSISCALLSAGPHSPPAELESPLRGGVIDKPVEEHVELRDLDTQPDALWSFLLFSG